MRWSLSGSCEKAGLQIKVRGRLRDRAEMKAAVKGTEGGNENGLNGDTREGGGAKGKKMSDGNRENACEASEWRDGGVGGLSCLPRCNRRIN